MRLRTLPWVACALLLAACTSNPLVDEAQRDLDAGRLDDGVAKLRTASEGEPANAALRAQYHRSREVAAYRLLGRADAARAAGDVKGAVESAEQTLRLDPGNPRAQGLLAQIRQDEAHAARLAEAEKLLADGKAERARDIARSVSREDPSSGRARGIARRADEAVARPTDADRVATRLKSKIDKPITLEFREAGLRAIFEVIARTAGINFVFDRDVKADLKASIFVRDTRIEDAIRILLATNGLDQKLLNENSILIYPNNAQKTKEYQDLIVRSFYLSNADGKVTQKLVNDFVKPKNLFLDEKLNMLIVRDTPEAMRMVEKLIRLQDLGSPEVMLEVEVLEIATDKLVNLGVQWPSQVSYSLVGSGGTTTSTTGTTTSGTPGQLTLREWLSRNAGLVQMNISNPALVLNLAQTDSNSNVLANPRIRVKNRDKAKIHIGDRVPVITTTSSGTAGSFVSQNVNYLDVGLQLEVEPVIQLNEEVEIKISLEVSSIVSEVRTGQNQEILAYRIGSRSANTTLRLRDGETEVLAGLIQDEERRSGARVPGVGELPVLGRLFSSNSNDRSKTEIVLLITPRVVRPLALPAAAEMEFPAGTEQQFGSTPVRIEATRPAQAGASAPPAAPGQLRPATPAPVTAPTAPGSIGGPQRPQ